MTLVNSVWISIESLSGWKWNESYGFDELISLQRCNLLCALNQWIWMFVVCLIYCWLCKKNHRKFISFHSRNKKIVFIVLMFIPVRSFFFELYWLWSGFFCSHIRIEYLCNYCFFFYFFLHRNQFNNRNLFLYYYYYYFSRWMLNV